MRVYYGKAVYGKEEIAATIDVLNKTISLIDGPSVKLLEKNCPGLRKEIWFNGKLRVLSQPPWSFKL